MNCLYCGIEILDFAYMDRHICLECYHTMTLKGCCKKARKEAKSKEFKDFIERLENEIENN